MIKFFVLVLNNVYIITQRFVIRKKFINAIQDHINKEYKFSHIPNMSIITFDNKMKMTYEYYITLPMQCVEIKLGMINSKKPHLINSFNSFHNHPFIRKFSHRPLNNQ